jgi:aspartate/methionine/tyrosine aminotransferase
MKYVRMPIEIEAPEQLGYDTIRCNLTESSYADFRLKELGLDLDDLLISYIDHRGHPGLRTLLSRETGGKVAADRVLITSGAAQALFIVSTTLLESGDELVVVRPNYGTNLETPRAIGASLRILDLSFESGWKTDPDRIREAITPRTKLVSITVPHNPTGARMSASDLQEIIEITGKAGCRLLVDETYREMSPDGVLPYAAGLAPHVISVASVSKTFGLPGIRVGWLMTGDEGLSEKFLAAKEQIQICGSALDEEIAFQFLQKRDVFLPPILANIGRRFGILKEWMRVQPHLEWVEPRGGCVAFPRFRREVLERVDLDLFYRVLNAEFSTHVGPGHWFEQPRSYMRIGYGWPTDQALQEGLENINRAASLALAGARRGSPR